MMTLNDIFEVLKEASEGGGIPNGVFYNSKSNAVNFEIDIVSVLLSQPFIDALSLSSKVDDNFRTNVLSPLFNGKRKGLKRGVKIANIVSETTKYLLFDRTGKANDESLYNEIKTSIKSNIESICLINYPNRKAEDYAAQYEDSVRKKLLKKLSVDERLHNTCFLWYIDRLLREGGDLYEALTLLVFFSLFEEDFLLGGSESFGKGKGEILIQTDYFEQLEHWYFSSCLTELTNKMFVVDTHNLISKANHNIDRSWLLERINKSVDNKNHIVFIKGDAGSGKTQLIRDYINQSKDSVLASYFINIQYEKTRTDKAILGSLINQVANYNTSFAIVISEFLQQNSQKLSVDEQISQELSADDLLKMLFDGLNELFEKSGCKRTIIALDGLDEVANTSLLEEMFKRINSISLGELVFIVSGRNSVVQEIQHYSGIIDFIDLNADEEQINSEIRGFYKQFLSSKWTTLDNFEEVLNILVEKADCNILSANWLVYYINKENSSIRSVNDIERLPKGLHDQYFYYCKRALLIVHNESEMFADFRSKYSLFFSLLCATKEPLSLSQIERVIDDENYDVQNCINTFSDFFIQDELNGKEKMVVFIHQSVREFFINDLNSYGVDIINQKFMVNLDKGNKLLADFIYRQVCDNYSDRYFGFYYEDCRIYLFDYHSVHDAELANSLDYQMFLAEQNEYVGHLTSVPMRYSRALSLCPYPVLQDNIKTRLLFYSVPNSRAAIYLCSVILQECLDVAKCSSIDPNVEGIWLVNLVNRVLCFKNELNLEVFKQIITNIEKVIIRIENQFELLPLIEQNLYMGQLVYFAQGLVNLSEKTETETIYIIRDILRKLCKKHHDVCELAESLAYVLFYIGIQQDIDSASVTLSELESIFAKYNNNMVAVLVVDLLYSISLKQMADDAYQTVSKINDIYLQYSEDEYISVKYALGLKNICFSDSPGKSKICADELCELYYKSGESITILLEYAKGLAGLCQSQENRDKDTFKKAFSKLNSLYETHSYISELVVIYASVLSVFCTRYKDGDVSDWFVQLRRIYEIHYNNAEVTVFFRNALIDCGTQLSEEEVLKTRSILNKLSNEYPNDSDIAELLSVCVRLQLK